MRPLRSLFLPRAAGAARAIAALLALALLVAGQNLHASWAHAATDDANLAVVTHADHAAPGHAHVAGDIAAATTPGVYECAALICVLCLALVDDAAAGPAAADPIEPLRLLMTSHSAHAERPYRPPISRG